MTTTATIIVAVSAIVILTLVLGIALPLISYRKMAKIAEEKGFDKTYYFRSNPQITATIECLSLRWLKNCVVTLMVYYPDGSFSSLKTTLLEFEKLWTDDPDSVPTYSFN